MRTYSLLALILVNFLLSKASIALEGVDERCISRDQVAVKGIFLDDREETVRAKLGKPSSTTQGIGEDDGGSYIGSTYVYDDLAISFIRGKVSEIRPLASGIKTIYGIEIGANFKDIRINMDFEPYTNFWKDPSAIFIPICIIYESYIKLKTDSDGVITEYRVFLETP